MKIKMLVPLCGLSFSLAPGDETDRFDDEEARRYIDAGYAVAVDGDEPDAPQAGEAQTDIGSSGAKSGKKASKKEAA